jgi:hypothetical protein
MLHGCVPVESQVSGSNDPLASPPLTPNADVSSCSCAGVCFQASYHRKPVLRLVDGVEFACNVVERLAGIRRCVVVDSAPTVCHHRRLLR